MKDELRCDCLSGPSLLAAFQSYRLFPAPDVKSAMLWNPEPPTKKNPSEEGSEPQEFRKAVEDYLRPFAETLAFFHHRTKNPAGPSHCDPLWETRSTTLAAPSAFALLVM